jgi:hypothetical protein
MSILLNLLLSALRAAISGQTAAAAMARIALSCLLILMSIILALAGLGFGLYAAFISLGPLMSPASAAAVIAATMMIIAAAMATLAFRRPSVSQPRSRAHAAAVSAEAIDSLANTLSQWVKANPGQATAVALVVGFIAGSRR